MITMKDIVNIKKTEDGGFEASVAIYNGNDNYTYKTISDKSRLEFVKELTECFRHRKFEDVHNGIIK